MSEEETTDDGLAPTGLPYMSPSRMTKVDDCPRAYSFRYPMHIRAPDKPTAAFGTKLHSVLEAYFKTGIMPAPEPVVYGNETIDVGRCAIAGLQFLPLPAAHLLIEHDWKRETFPGVWYTGKIDVYDCERAYEGQQVNSDGSVTPIRFEIGDHSDEIEMREHGGTWSALDTRGNPIPLIVDHKSTGDFKWLKSPKALRGTGVVKGDPQPGFYGEEACAKFLERFGYETEWVHFRWVYYLRSNDARARAVDLRLTRAQIREIVDQWEPSAVDAITLHKIEQKGNDVPPNTSSCSKFGGCEYGPAKKWAPGNLNICRLSTGERLGAFMTTPIPLSQQVAALLNNGTAPATPVASASPFTAGAPAPGASPFTAANPPEAQAASALQASSPFTAPAAPPVSAPAASASPFTAGTPATGGFATLPPTAQAAPAGNVSPFAAAPPVSAPAAPAAAVSPFAGFTAPAPAAPAVDPRVAEIPSNIAPNQHALWLQHCDTNGLDHRTGQPKGNAAAVIPQPSSTAAPTDPQATFKALAQQMYGEGRACDANTHPDVKRYYDALCTVNGPPANLQAPAVVEPVARKRRKKKDAQGNDTDEDEDKTYQITITKRAVQEAIGFLTSLAQQMPD